MDNNKKQISLLADVFSLLIAFLLLGSFIVLPWVKVSLVVTTIREQALDLLLDYIDLGDYSLQTIMLGILLLNILLVLVALVTAVLIQPLSRSISYLTLLLGIVIITTSVVYYIDFNNTVNLQGAANIFGAPLAADLAPRVDVGFWLVIVGGMMLIFQVFAPRMDGQPVEVVTEEAQVVINAQQPARHRKAPASKLANAWLLDPRTQARHNILQDQTRIGRTKSRNDIAIEGANVSREHALIRETNGQFILYDRASAHGVRVNGQLIRGPYVLEHNDRISFGDVELHFVKPQ